MRMGILLNTVIWAFSMTLLNSSALTGDPIQLICKLILVYHLLTRTRISDDCILVFPLIQAWIGIYNRCSTSSTNVFNNTQTDLLLLLPRVLSLGD